MLLTESEVAWAKLFCKGENFPPRNNLVSLAAEVLLNLDDPSLAGGILDWRSFEQLISIVLQKVEYICITPYRYFGIERQRREIDVLAYSENRILAIDCKHYSKNRSTISQLKSAASLQKERVLEFIDSFTLTPPGFITKTGSYQIIPLIVPWAGDKIIHHSDALIVPSALLIQFLHSILQYSLDIPSHNLTIIC